MNNNKLNPWELTIGNKYGLAMEVTTEEQAATYFQLCVAHNMLWGNSREEAERVERINIGYYTGYMKMEQAEKIRKLYGFSHPIFGG